MIKIYFFFLVIVFYLLKVLGVKSWNMYLDEIFFFIVLSCLYKKNKWGFFCFYVVLSFGYFCLLRM